MVFSTGGWYSAPKKEDLRRGWEVRLRAAAPNVGKSREGSSRLERVMVFESLVSGAVARRGCAPGLSLDVRRASIARHSPRRAIVHEARPTKHGRSESVRDVMRIDFGRAVLRGRRARLAVAPSSLGSMPGVGRGCLRPWTGGGGAWRLKRARCVAKPANRVRRDLSRPLARRGREDSVKRPVQIARHSTTGDRV